MNADPLDAVLIVEDDAALREALCETLRDAGLNVLEAGDGHAALEVLERREVALVISDVQMPGMGGELLLGELRRRRPDLPTVLMTAYGNITQAVAAMREGALDYLVKPFDAQALIALARRHLAERVTSQEIVAEDPESKRIAALARRLAATDATVLITGESGTGKEVYARFIRDHSARAEGPFVAINCAAIPENMLEATLFGYEKGAFTGATTAHPGKFEQAQGGTLLLDEISEMSLGLQAKLLRVLQEREVERLGGQRTLKLDVRVIATSNRDLPEEVRAGRFRADLYYRLNVLSLRLPALRERPGDILPLARRALRTARRPDRAALTLSLEAGQRLLEHEWPGNARELTNVVQRAAWLAVGGRIEAQDLEIDRLAIEMRVSSSPAPVPAVAAPREREPGESPRGAEQASATPVGAAEASGLGRDLKERERELILATLRATGGSRKHAAERLGISARTLRHKLKQLKAEGIIVPRLIDSSWAA
jgi:two-component system response regulator FlrC